jgi:hypothetical protein
MSVEPEMSPRQATIAASAMSKISNVVVGGREVTRHCPIKLVQRVSLPCSAACHPVILAA